MVETVSVRLADVPGLQVVTPRAAVEAAEDNPSFARRGAAARRDHASRRDPAARERSVSASRIASSTRTGHQIAADAIDGSELFALQDRVADGVARDLQPSRGKRRTPDAIGPRHDVRAGAVSPGDRPAAAVRPARGRREGARDPPDARRREPQLRPRPGGARARLPRDVRLHEGAARGPTGPSPPANRAQALDPGAARSGRDRRRDAARDGARRRRRSRRSAGPSRRGRATSKPFSASGARHEPPGTTAAAETAFRRAIELQPSFAVFNQLGAWYYADGRYAEAADMFRRASRSGSRQLLGPRATSAVRRRCAATSRPRSQAYP